MRFPRVLARLALVCGISAACGPTSPAQSAQPAPDLATLVQQLPSQPVPTSAALIEAVDTAAHAATLPEIERQLPILLNYLDSPLGPERSLALITLFALVARQHPDRTVDTSVSALLVPHLDRLAPHLHNADPATRNGTLPVLQTIAALRPTPPALLSLLLTELQRPDATTPPPSPSPQTLGYPAGTQAKSGEAALGPEILFILLPAAATYAVDPATGITEGHDSPEVQAAVIAFIQRPDQTPASLAETMRAISLAQAQNPDVNAALIPFLNSHDPPVTRSLLSYMNRLTLSSATFAAAHARVEQLANNPDVPGDERTLATRLLTCWHNNRHELCDPSMGR